MMCIVETSIHFTVLFYSYIYIAYFILKNRGNSDGNLIKKKEKKKKTFPIMMKH